MVRLEFVSIRRVGPDRKAIYGDEVHVPAEELEGGYRASEDAVLPSVPSVIARECIPQARLWLSLRQVMR